jgi:hypothetical protein
MSDPSLASLAEPLTSLAKPVWRHIQLIRRERQAAWMPLARDDDLLDKLLDETLARLCAGGIDTPWWQKLLDRIEHRYVTPEFLHHPAIQKWLANPQVQADLKAIARRRIMGISRYDEDARKRLRKAYAEQTGEEEFHAAGIIAVVLSVLASGFLASLDRPLEPLAGLIQASIQETTAGFQRTDERFDEVLGAIGPDHYVVEAHSKEALKELNLILRRRSVVPTLAREESGALAQRIATGDLWRAEPSMRAKALYWAARLHALQATTIPTTRSYLEQLRQIDPGHDTRVIDALILETQGDVDTALRILRDDDTHDGRAALFAVLSRARGDAAALAWFDDVREHDEPAFFTCVGWCNLAVSLACADRWEEAVHRLAIVRQCWEEWPDIAFVEGVINAAMLLPSEHRGYALTMNLFHPAIHTIEGPDADRYRAIADTCFLQAAQLMTEIGLDSRA